MQKKNSSIRINVLLHLFFFPPPRSDPEPSSFSSHSALPVHDGVRLLVQQSLHTPFIQVLIIYYIYPESWLKRWTEELFQPFQILIKKTKTNMTCLSRLFMMTHWHYYKYPWTLCKNVFLHNYFVSLKYLLFLIPEFLFSEKLLSIFSVYCCINWWEKIYIMLVCFTLRS